MSKKKPTKKKVSHKLRMEGAAPVTPRETKLEALPPADEISREIKKGQDPVANEELQNAKSLMRDLETRLISVCKNCKHGKITSTHNRVFCHLNPTPIRKELTDKCGQHQPVQHIVCVDDSILYKDGSHLMIGKILDIADDPSYPSVYILKLNNEEKAIACFREDFLVVGDKMAAKVDKYDLDR